MMKPKVYLTQKVNKACFVPYPPTMSSLTRIRSDATTAGIKTITSNGLQAIVRTTGNTAIADIKALVDAQHYISDHDRFVVEVAVEKERIYLVCEFNANPWWILETVAADINAVFDKLLLIIHNNKACLKKTRGFEVLAKSVKYSVSPKLAALLC